MSDWGNEIKSSKPIGRGGMDKMLKDARRGDLEAVQRQLSRDPSLLLAMSGGHCRTFLWEATRGNRPELVKYLLKIGADPNTPGRISAEVNLLLKPYCIARKFGRIELSQLLLQAGTVIDIYSACFLGDSNRVQTLLDEDPTFLFEEQDEDFYRVTPLHFAVAGGHEKLTRSLIEQGAKVAPYTRMLFFLALRIERLDLIKLLVDSGADPSKESVSALLSGPEDFAKFFADKGIDVNQDNDKQWPPLIYICRGDRGGDPLVVKRLIDLGINVNVCNYKGKTALHVAAKSGFVPATQLLLDHGAQVNALDPNGETAMFDLIRSTIKRTEWQLGVLSLLLENGADVSIRRFNYEVQ
jgi:ankyrin repeat protein